MSDEILQDLTNVTSDVGADAAPGALAAEVDPSLADSLIDPLAASVDEGDAIQFGNPNSNLRGGTDGFGPKVHDRVEHLDDVIADLDV